MEKRYTSQSLWVRGRFLIFVRPTMNLSRFVAIPLGQGQVFNEVFQVDDIRYASQSLWVRGRFLIVRGAFSPCFQCVAEGVSNFCFCEKVGASAVVFIRVFHGVFGVALLR